MEKEGRRRKTIKVCKEGAGSTDLNEQGEVDKLEDRKAKHRGKERTFKVLSNGEQRG